MTAVIVENGRARVVFDRFDLEAYRLFLRCKQLPERELRLLDRHRGIYAIETAERYAAILDASYKRAAGAPSPLAAHLFEYQRFIVGRALEVVFENLAEKQRRFDEAADEMEQAYVDALKKGAL